MEHEKQIREELDALIRNTFAPVPYPGDDNIVAAEALHDLDVIELLDAVKGRTWEEAMPRLINGKIDPDDALFFTPSGFHYYFPAYLIHLLHWKEPDVEGVRNQQVDFYDVRGVLEVDAEYMIKLYQEFSEVELKTITQVLRGLRELHGEDSWENDVLVEYWDRFGCE